MQRGSVNKVLQTIAIILAALCVIFGGVYVLFDILDDFNPMLHFLNQDWFLTRNLDRIVGVLAVLLGIVVTIRTGRVWNLAKRKQNNKAQ